MPLTIHPDTVPLRVDERGDVRVGKSNVLFYVLIEHFEDGMSAEELVQGYDTIDPSDVYGAIAYYLRHKDEVRAYLREVEREAAEVRKEIEARQPARPNFRQELLARKANMGNIDATTRHR